MPPKVNQLRPKPFVTLDGLLTGAGSERFVAGTAPLANLQIRTRQLRGNARSDSPPIFPPRGGLGKPVCDLMSVRSFEHWERRPQGQNYHWGSTATGIVTFHSGNGALFGNRCVMSTNLSIQVRVGRRSRGAETEALHAELAYAQIRGQIF